MGAPATAAVERPPVEAVADERLDLAKKVERRITLAMFVAHGVGAIELFLLLWLVLPMPPEVEIADRFEPNLIAALIYLPLAMIAGTILGKRLSAARAAWVREGREPTPAERAAQLNSPIACMRVDGGLWLGAVILFFAINAKYSMDLALHVATTIALGGLMACAAAYLLIERLNRPITAIVLAAGPPPKPTWPGVEGRLVLAWLSASGIPLIGLALLAIHAKHDATLTGREVATSVLVLTLLALAFGAAMMVLAARTVSSPLTSVRRALARVETGDLSAHVQVDDASEVGTLQTGFNRMVSGLREREQMRDLYSRQVGEDVAQVSLDDAPRLGGEVRDVAILFVDMIGSTAMASKLPPEHVLDRLNRFFAVVVDVIEQHGGWVNKFEGDAALCIFGAPSAQRDCAARALAAGRDLHRRLEREMPDTQVGIGLSSGPAVAGWVGAERRFEYSVIGDPVNEAARLCELAKTRPGGVLASQSIVDCAGDGEGRLWKLGEQLVLRGRHAPTRLAQPL